LFCRAALVPWYAISAEFVGALLLIPGIYARWASLYAVPLMIGAAHFWLVRKGFYFTAAGCEFPIVWTILLLSRHFCMDRPCVASWI
jgi:putative oxidoreductase